MSSRRTVALLAAGLAVAALAVLGIFLPERDAPQEHALTAPAGPAASLSPAQRSLAPAPTNVRNPVSEAEPAVPAPPNPNPDPLVREYEERLQFQQRVRAFFTEAPALSPVERSARAQAIAQEVTRYEARGEVSAAEAFTVRAALIRETAADPAEQVEAIAALQEHYRQQGQRKQAEWEARSDPQFELYKAREREIVAEVMAMSRVPDGLSRDQYLQQRLQRAREQLIGN